MPPNNPAATTDRVDLRLPFAVTALLDSLAASCGPGVIGGHRGGGGRKQAACEAIAQFHRAVAEAGRLNADELSEDNWIALGHLNDLSSEADELFGRDYGIDWSQRIARELAYQFDGRAVITGDPRPKHSRELACRIAAWGSIRGYALMAALRYFWRNTEAGIGVCAEPEIWMTPATKSPPHPGS